MELNPDCSYPVLIHRAAGEFALKNDAAFRQRLTEVLDHKLAQIDYLSMEGILSLFSRLWKAVQTLDETDPLRERFLDVTIASGCAPDEIFDNLRELGEIQDGLSFFRCTLLQPLDERWPDWFGCMNEESEYKQYAVEWGVLAESEEAAASIALQWQKRSFPLPAKVTEVSCAGQDYRDRPGIVWQGARSNTGE
jgi:hypothetical protein